MNKPLRIGVTGGIGSGKSVVCKIFSALGMPVYDADSRAKQLMTVDKILIEKIKEQFGESSYSIDGSLNRDFLGKEVFNDPRKLEQLNQLVHPRVGDDYEQWVEKNKSVGYVVKEAALLFESESYKMLDKIIVVTAPEDLRIQRVMDRDKRSKEGILKIIRSQMPEEEKINRADFIIYNDETTLIVPEVMKLHERFIAFIN